MDNDRQLMEAMLKLQLLTSSLKYEFRRTVISWVAGTLVGYLLAKVILYVIELAEERR